MNGPWEVAVPAGAEFGERPFWDPAQTCLIWVDGTLVTVPPVHTSQPTCPAFGGLGLDGLYLTTAWEGMTAQQRAAEPLAGHVLRARPGATGHPVLAFGG